MENNFRSCLELISVVNSFISRSRLRAKFNRHRFRDGVFDPKIDFTKYGSMNISQGRSRCTILMHEIFKVPWPIVF